jgi:50S ribosomal subunit-associated GTPase HflX
VVALNKIDKLENPPLIQEMVAGFPNSLAISARERLGLTELLGRVETVLNQKLMYVTVCIPYHESGLVSLFHRQGTVDREEHSKEGTVLAGRLPARYLEAFRHYLV